MSSTVSLDSIRQAADAKYGSYNVVLGDPENPVRLLNVLRLSKAARNKVEALQKELTALSEEEPEGTVDDVAVEEVRDQEDIISDMLRTVAETPGQAEALLTAINGDLAVLVSIMEGYGEGTQVGEASASAA